ncbi:MAG TPA: DUF2800 domain-containing protein [Candidatus Avidehalobacter gallistercoris]|uniref:DUF2800 domain-containing protein n=1 Tax=Candidatus Avidehalobacter gallistercoris TaxID=2840694 RepID=A0A9D1HJX0_9FIRM|nr:DUF2800 domain-containing protein [Candidatus Avidehalobacter gallistercoris]
MPDKHAILSPSAAHRWLHCTPAPRVEAEFPETTSEYAEEGRLAHSVCELAAKKKFTVMNNRAYNSRLKKLKADPKWDDEMLSTAATYVEHLTEHAMRFEHAPYVALEVQVDITDYAPEAFGTCDCIMIGGDELIITDYKHGKGVPVSAQDNPQMLLYALGALKLYRPIYGDMIRRVSTYIDQPRLDSYDGASMTVEELLAWGESIKPKAAAAFMGTGEFAPGEWCRFCRAKAKCRARANQNTALEDFKDCIPLGRSIPMQTEYDATGFKPSNCLTDEEIGALLVRAEGLVAWYNDLKEYALVACLNGKTIPGWKAVEGRSTRAWTDQDAALEALMAGGVEEAIIYDRVPKTLAQLEKVIGKQRFGELVGGMITKSPGKPALAAESDKRPAYNGAAADFSEVKAI